MLAIEVLFPVVYKIRECKCKYNFHHGLLNLYVDRVIPMWMKTLRHEMISPPGTIAYYDPEQDPVDPEQALLKCFANNQPKEEDNMT